MKLIIDKREISLIKCCEDLLSTSFVDKKIQLKTEMLPLGDCIIENDDGIQLIMIERKCLTDLMASITDGRYMEQSYRLSHSDIFSPHNIIYLIEGDVSKVPLNERQLIYSTITSLQYFKGFSTMQTNSMKDSAEWLLQMGDKIERNIKNNKKGMDENITGIKTDEYCKVVKSVKKENINMDTIGPIMLCQIPGISSSTALVIMRLPQIQGSILNFLHILSSTDTKCIEDARIGSRRVGTVLVKKMKSLLLPTEIEKREGKEETKMKEGKIDEIENKGKTQISKLEIGKNKVGKKRKNDQTKEVHETKSILSKQSKEKTPSRFYSKKKQFINDSSCLFEIDEIKT